MTKVVKKLALIIAILMGVAIMLSPFEVMASSGTDIRPTLTFSIVGGDDIKLEEFCNKINDYAGFEFLQCSSTGNTKTINLIVDTGTYKRLPQDEKSKIMEFTLDNIKDSGMSSTSRNRVYNFIANLDSATSSLVRQLSSDVNADFFKAYSGIKPVLGWFSLALGIFVLFMFGALSITLVLDIAYIAIPLFQVGLNSYSQKEGQPSGPPKIVSREAWKAVEATADLHSKRDTMVTYLHLKTKQLIVLSICILYLVGGKIFIFIGSFMDMFSGLLG